MLWHGQSVTEKTRGFGLNIPLLWSISTPEKYSYVSGDSWSEEYLYDFSALKPLITEHLYV